MIAKHPFSCRLFAATLMVLSGLTSGCVQMPTEKQQVADIRPQISFRLESDIARNAVVSVDGLDAGIAGNYEAGRAALKIEAGTHVVRVQAGDRVLLEERFYVADGVSKTFIIR